MRTKKFGYVLLAGAFALSLVTFNAKAGDNSRFSVGAELALPMGSFGDQSGTGFGGSLRYEMPVGDNLGLMLTAGYLTFGGKTIDLGGFGKFEYTNSAIPIQLGAKYYFTEQQNGFYGQVELGVHMLSTKASFDFLGISTSTTETSTAFSYAPGIGYHLDNLDFGLKYQLFSETVTSTDLFGNSVSATSSASYLGLRVAYVFGEK